MMSAVKQMHTEPDTDEALLLRFQQNGSQDALAALYLRYTDLVYGVCLKYLENAESAKDAVMNIYEELLQKLPHQQINNFRSWLYVVAKNHCRMELRRNSKVKVIEFEPAHVQSDNFMHLDAVPDKEAEFKKLQNCMEILGDEQRKAIQLFYLDAKCYNEISNETEWDWNKVRSLIQNGRRNLKICMEKDDE